MQLENVKAYIARRWPFILGLVALVVIGQFFDKSEMSATDLARAGVQLTRSIYNSLENQRPGQVVDRYLNVLYPSKCTQFGSRRICSPSTEFGPKDLGSMVFGIITATPTVAVDTWETGSWFARLLLIATMSFVLLMVIAGVRYRNPLLVVGAIIFGPAILGLVFWVALLFLMLLVLLVGKVLAGIVVLIGTFGGWVTFGKRWFEAFKKADEFDTKVVPFLKRLLGIKTDIAASSSPIPPSGMTPPVLPPPPA
jgi:hypothetical protein